jgi:hypothetical protein
MNRLLKAVTTIEQTKMIQHFIFKKHDLLYIENEKKANLRNSGDIVYYVVDTASISNNGKLKTHSLNQVATIEITNHNVKRSCSNWDYIHKGGKKASYFMASDSKTFDTKEEALIFVIEKQLYWFLGIISQSIEPSYGSKASWVKGLEYSIDKMNKNYSLEPTLYDVVINNILKEL